MIKNDMRSFNFGMSNSNFKKRGEKKLKEKKCCQRLIVAMSWTHVSPPDRAR
jgi:hypothetical protein